MELLQWLQNWYKDNCDGYWEHLYGIKIENLDNPGWNVKIDLSDTYLENAIFENVEYDNGEDWLFCKVEDNVFYGLGDEQKLIAILQIFKDFAEN